MLNPSCSPDFSKNEKWARLLLALAVLVYGVYFSLYQIQRHQAFWTDGDLVSLEQPIWNTLHGDFMRTTYYPIAGERVSDFTQRATESALGDHVQPILLALALPYAIIPRAETLLVVVSVGVGLGAIPLFRIARRRLQSAWWALMFAALYLFLPAVQTNNVWDVHGSNLLPPLLLAALDAVQSGRRGRWWVWTLLAMCCREDMPFLVGWAMVWMAPQTHRREALIMAGLGLALSLFYFGWVIPHFGGGGTPYLVRFFPLGTDITPQGILAAMGQRTFWQYTLTNLVAYNLRLAVPLLGLFWLHGSSLLAMAPTLLVNGLSWYPQMQFPGLWHYSASIIPWALVGAVEGLAALEGRLKSWKPDFKWRVVMGEALAVSVAAAHFLGGYTPLGRGFVWPAPTGREQTMTGLLRSIPADAPVSSELQLAAHLAARKTLRFFPDRRGAEWIVMDVWFGQYHYLSEAEGWRQVMADAGWQTAAARDGLIVLQRGQGPPRDVEQAFRPRDALPALTAQFGDSIQLRGAAFFPRQDRFFICTDWLRQGRSSLVPWIEAQLAPTQVVRQPLDTLRFAPTIFAEPGPIRDCTQFVLPRGGTVTLRLMVRTGIDEWAPVRLVNAGAWQGRAQAQEHQLVLRLP